MTMSVIKGVDQLSQNIYLMEPFRCLDGVGYGVVNDEFCDCLDQSDEPGTSACYRGSFYCQNEGFLPKIVSSWIVNDGICDCCDGSDEADDVCASTCVESSLNEAKKKQEQEMGRKLGAIAKLDLIRKAKELRASKLLEIQKLHRELKGWEIVKTTTDRSVKSIQYQLNDPDQNWMDKVLGALYYWIDCFGGNGHLNVDAKEKLDNARTELTETLKKLDDLKSAKSRLESVLKSENGKNDVFLPYRDECLDWFDSGYQYRFCWFDEVKQDHISLGKFDAELWDPKSGKMVYLHGSPCWNGPERSTSVILSCGVEPKIISMEEPHKCQYLLKVSTPAVCKIAKEDRISAEHQRDAPSEL